MIFHPRVAASLAALLLFLLAIPVVAEGSLFAEGSALAENSEAVEAVLAESSETESLETESSDRRGSLIHEEAEVSSLSVISIADNVHVALGQGPSSMAMIEGPDGLVIIDSLASEEASARVMTAFREISALPVAAVILTHLHRDHSGGLGVVAEGNVPVYSRVATVAGDDTGNTFPHQATTAGDDNPPGEIPLADIPLRQPITARHPISVGGIELELVAAHGDQQLWLWYPDKGLLFSGDAFYTSFPAIHALHNTVAETRDWLTTLDAMLEQSPHFLVSSHGYPIIGQQQSVEALKQYRDTIALVLDETLSGIARGMSPEALAATIHLPPELAGQPFLEPRYARLSWAIRAIYADHRGWFDGNPTHLEPLPAAELAARIAELAGGPEPLLENGLLALDNGDYAWAAQLADYLLSLAPEHAAARHMKADALVGLAEQTDTLPARDYYLQAARELRRSAE